MKKYLLLCFIATLGFSTDLEINGSGDFLLENGKLTASSFYLKKENNKYIVSTGSNFIINGNVYKEEKGEPLSELRIDKIDSITISGKNNFVLNNLKQENLNLNISGSSKINLNNIQIKNFRLEGNGNSLVYLKKSYIEKANIILSGSSFLDVYHSKIIDKKTSLSGFSNIINF